MKPRDRSLDRNLVAGLVLCLALVGGVGGWAGSTEIAGAVVAGGHLVVNSYVKKVQHPVGGVVGELRVGEGEHVSAGDVLLRLDATEDRATLAMIDARITELTARRARLVAERDGGADIVFSPMLLAREGAETVMTGERALFVMRREARDGRKDQLAERIRQYEIEIGGLEQQIVAYDDGLAVLAAEIEQLQRLRDQGAVSVQRLNGLLTSSASFRADRGAAVAAAAEAGGRIAETRLQILQVDHEVRVEAGAALTDVEATLAGLAERRIAAADRVARVDLVAPQSGRVKDLSVHAAGSVITPAETVMLIVPDGDELAADLEIAPRDIDDIVPGQVARLRMSALDRRTTPELVGRVARIGADLSTDPRSGRPYYLVRVTLPADEIARLGGQALVPGMPVEGFVTTGERSVLTYIVRPIEDQMNRALREN